MRESISNTFIFNLILVFITILIVLLVGSLSYSKAYKVKNKIIEIIEKHNSYEAAREDISNVLKSIGYRVNRTGQQNCRPQTNDGGQSVYAINKNSDYRYCVYPFSTARGRYYRVVAYMYFDIPIIGREIEIPVYGETKIIYELNEPS